MLHTHEHLINLIRDTILENGLIHPHDRALVAVSGGMDSMVLLDLLIRLRVELRCELAVVHVNHRLRGAESEADEDLVKSIAREYGIPCHTQAFDIGEIAEREKRAVQEIAHEIRYRYFRELRQEHGYQVVATAHHADDNAETILFNLVRGSGVAGLTGIALKHRDECAIRPMLFATREQIAFYAGKHSIRYREDSSNVKSDYTRNFLRHRIVPLLREQMNPNLASTLTRMSRSFADLDSFLTNILTEAKRDLILRHSEQEIVIGLRTFLTMSPFMQEYALFSIAREFSSCDTDSGLIREMIKITMGGTGKRCSLSEHVIFLKNREELILKKVPPEEPYAIPIEIERSYDFDEFSFRTEIVDSVNFSNDRCVEYIDSDTVDRQLVLRSWEEGDWFIPLGMTEKRKLSDFFIDEKIPLFEKKRIPILESEGKIVWICGKRLDDRCKISSSSTHFLKMEYRPRKERE